MVGSLTARIASMSVFGWPRKQRRVKRNVAAGIDRIVFVSINKVNSTEKGRNRNMKFVVLQQPWRLIEIKNNGHSAFKEVENLRHELVEMESRLRNAIATGGHSPEMETDLIAAHAEIVEWLARLEGRGGKPWLERLYGIGRRWAGNLQKA